MKKWLWLATGLAALTAISIPLVNHADSNFLIITLECDQGTFTQTYADSVNFANEGNYFWAGAKVIPGDFNLDGQLTNADIIYLVRAVLKADTVRFTPTDTNIAIYYVEDSSGAKRIKFIQDRR